VVAGRSRSDRRRSSLVQDPAPSTSQPSENLSFAEGFDWFVPLVERGVETMALGRAVTFTLETSGILG
jgi:hypothetical protein